jgi:hypothetical protein
MRCPFLCKGRNLEEELFLDISTIKDQTDTLPQNIWNQLSSDAA